jgi:hypothetical protein
MTVYDIYDQTIKSLPAGERLQLARLILNDLSPDEPLDLVMLEREGEILDQDHLEELLRAGLNSGPGIEATPEYWREKRRALLERHTQKVLQR